MTSADDKMMMSARDDVAKLLARVARVANETVKTVREARENCAAYTSDVWKYVSYPMKPILFWKSRSKKDESNGGEGNKIGATLVVCETHVKFVRNFDRCVDGQMKICLVALCRGIEKLHGDGSYVLIGGRSDRSNDGNGFGSGWWASGSRDSTLRTSDGGGAVGRGLWYHVKY